MGPAPAGNALELVIARLFCVCEPLRRTFIPNLSSNSFESIFALKVPRRYFDPTTIPLSSNKFAETKYLVLFSPPLTLIPNSERTPVLKISSCQLYPVPAYCSGLGKGGGSLGRKSDKASFLNSAYCCPCNTS